MTAVEWLVETLNKKYGNDDFIITFINEIEQAKEMEKQQMKEMYLKGIENYDPTFKNK
jgi:disulfide oxidoreductase YuzD